MAKNHMCESKRVFLSKKYFGLQSVLTSLPCPEIKEDLRQALCRIKFEHIQVNLYLGCDMAKI